MTKRTKTKSYFVRDPSELAYADTDERGRVVYECIGCGYMGRAGCVCTADDNAKTQAKAKADEQKAADTDAQAKAELKELQKGYSSYRRRG